MNVLKYSAACITTMFATYASVVCFNNYGKALEASSNVFDLQPLLGKAKIVSCKVHRADNQGRIHLSDYQNDSITCNVLGSNDKLYEVTGDVVDRNDDVFGGVEVHDDGDFGVATNDAAIFYNSRFGYVIETRQANIDMFGMKGTLTARTLGEDGKYRNGWIYDGKQPQAYALLTGAPQNWFEDAVGKLLPKIPTGNRQGDEKHLELRTVLDDAVTQFNQQNQKEALAACAQDIDAARTQFNEIVVPYLKTKNPFSLKSTETCSVASDGNVMCKGFGFWLDGAQNPMRETTSWQMDSDTKFKGTPIGFSYRSDERDRSFSIRMSLSDGVNNIYRTVKTTCDFHADTCLSVFETHRLFSEVHGVLPVATPFVDKETIKRMEMAARESYVKAAQLRRNLSF